MSEVDEMIRLITAQRKLREDVDKAVTLAIADVDRTRKEKRDKSNRPN